MNYDNEEIIKIRDYIYKFIHFDKLICHILSEYYNDIDKKIIDFKKNKESTINFDKYLQTLYNYMLIVYPNNS